MQWPERWKVVQIIKSATQTKNAIMSLKNYIFTSVATKHPIASSGADTTIDEEQQQHQASSDRRHRLHRTDTGLPEEVDVLATQLSWLGKAWEFISVEPVMICWLLPSCLLYIAIENLALEKVLV